MNTVKIRLLNDNYIIYYTDTDSLYISKKIPKDLESPTELGLFKLEHKVSDAIFISNKLYYIKDNDNSIKIVTKGINLPILKTQFEILYNNEIVKLHLNKSFRKLTRVLFNDNIPINLSPQSYIKRIKIFRNKKWVNLRPIKL